MKKERTYKKSLLCGNTSLYWTLLLYTLFVLATTQSHAVTTTCSTMRPEQVLAQADVIVYGRVTGISSRWTGAGEAMIATDYAMEILSLAWDPERILGEKVVRDTMTLTFAGGQIGKKSVWIPGIPEFPIGETVILMIDRQNLGAISPLVGIYMGVYRTSQQGHVIDHTGASVTRSFFSSTNDRPGGFSPSEFIQSIRSSIQRAKTDGMLNREEPRRNTPMSNVFSGNQIPLPRPEHIISGRNADGLRVTLEIENTNNDGPSSLPSLHTVEDGIPATVEHINNDYGFQWGAPNIPSVFNIPPMYYSGAQWGLNFEYSGSDWNRYASDVFMKYTTAYNTFGHNSRNDFAFTNATTFQQAYGFQLGSSTLGIAVMYNSNGSFIGDGQTIHESDVILNVAFDWTLDFQTAYNDPDICFFRSTVIHELGHCIGRRHQFTETSNASWHSVMNYTNPGPIETEFHLPFMDDAESIRAAYPTRSVSITDLGLSLKRTLGGIANFSWASFPVSVQRGSSFPLSGFVIENAGTATASPAVTWYLSNRNNTWSGATYYALQTTSYGSLPRFYYYPNLTMSIQVPASVRAGEYYIVGELQSDGYDGNRYAWSNERITVTNPPATLVGLSPANGQTGQTLDVDISGTGFVNDTQVYFGPGISVQTVNPINSSLLRATITIAPSATLGSRSVSVSNPSPGGGSSTLSNVFSVGIAVYPGDANNDGIADVRDILPIGQFFGIAGPPRGAASVSWQPQLLLNEWSIRDACYADCDGNGRVESADVQAIIRNWGHDHGSPDAPADNPIIVCGELLREIDRNGPVSGPMLEIRNAITSYLNEQMEVPLVFSLDQNWPNPFNPSTRLRFSVATEVSIVQLTVYDILGQQVWATDLHNVQPGSHEVLWMGMNTAGEVIPSGIYFYRLTAGTFTAVRRMMLLK
ncbi:MAG: FlgD immunoglobulin-like domain containing protein [Bacteroidota bacterium]